MGKVYLVGAGPGDPGLITVKGHKLIREADVIIYDYLANDRFLDEAERETECIYVGKQGSRHAMSQDDINRLILSKAKTAHTIVRLKGGDPFIFGRGGEEAEVLAAEGIEFEIVPGITSAIAVPAYAGIPLTHRDFASSVAFITGHEDENKTTSSLQWDKLAGGPDTLVFLMGVGNLRSITERLIGFGKDPRTPAAVIQWGTLPQQRTVVGRLDTIADEAENQRISPPGIIVVGDVVMLRSRLAWYEQKPLFGKRIAITRPRSQSVKLAEMLGARGARIFYLPTIEITALTPNTLFTDAIDNLHTFNGVIFTSVNAVRLFFDELARCRKDARACAGLRIIAIGPATEALLRTRGIVADIVPSRYTSEGIIDALRGADLSNKRFLLPRAQEGRDILPRYIQENGGTCAVVPLYRTEGAQKVPLTGDDFDLITFTSSSTVTHFVTLYGLPVLQDKIIASIGPVTSETVARLVRPPDIEAAQSDIPGLVDAIDHYYSSR